MFKIAIVFFATLAFVEAKVSTLRGHDNNAPQDGQSPKGDNDEAFENLNDASGQLSIDTEDFEGTVDVDLAFDVEDSDAQEEFLRHLKITKKNILDPAPWRSPLGQLQDAIQSSFDGIELEENSCTNTNEPTCFYNLRAKPGTWLCQKTYDVLTGEEQFRSICANSKKWKLPEPNHSCGCCGGQCPPPCKCGCGFGQPDGSYLGVYVVNKYGRESCVRKELALWAANVGGEWSCKEECEY